MIYYVYAPWIPISHSSQVLLILASTAKSYDKPILGTSVTQGKQQLEHNTFVSLCGQ